MNTLRSNRGPLESTNFNTQESHKIDLLFDIIKRYYGIEIQGVSNLPIQISHTSQKIAFISCGRLFIVKFMPKYVSSRGMYENRLQTVAKLSEIFEKVVNPEPNLIGNFTTQFLDKYFWISAYIDSSSYDGSDIQAEEAARDLSMLHSALQRVSDIPYLKFRTSFSFAMQFITMAHATRTDPEENDLLARLTNLARSLNVVRLCDYDTQLIHGDPTIPNFGFTKFGSVACICDFDDLARGSIVRDLATLVLSTCGLSYLDSSSSLSKTIKSEFDFDRALKLFDAYREKGNSVNLHYVWNEILLVWVEMICLGLIRGDFSANNVLKCIDSWLLCWEAGEDGALRIRD